MVTLCTFVSGAESRSKQQRLQEAIQSSAQSTRANLLHTICHFHSLSKTGIANQSSHQSWRFFLLSLELSSAQCTRQPLSVHPELVLKISLFFLLWGRSDCQSLALEPHLNSVPSKRSLSWCSFKQEFISERHC